MKYELSHPDNFGSKSISVNSCSHCCFYLLSFPRVYRNMFFTQSLTKHNFTILDLRRTKLFGYGIDKTKRNVYNSELLFRILLYIFLSVNTATFRHVETTNLFTFQIFKHIFVWASLKSIIKCYKKKLFYRYCINDQRVFDGKGHQTNTNTFDLTFWKL